LALTLIGGQEYYQLEFLKHWGLGLQVLNSKAKYLESRLRVPPKQKKAVFSDSLLEILGRDFI
jgi:hypothetical protein